jgi:hypothetical protein
VFGRKEYLVKIANAHDGAKFFHHRAKLTPIKEDDMAGVIPKITSSMKKMEVQLHLPTLQERHTCLR